MSYKIVRITDLYNEYINQYYQKFPDVDKKSYEEQYVHLTSHSLDIVSSISKNLQKIGVDATNIFTNAAALQAQWKKENKCEKSDKDLIIEQLKILQPHIVWLDDISLIDRDWILHVRNNIPSVRIMTGHICAPYNDRDLENIKTLDFLFTCTPCLKYEFEKKGIKTFLIYHSFEPGVLDKIQHENDYTENDLIFTGSLYTGGGFHKTRIEYLEQMIKSNLPLRIYGNTDTFSKILSKQLAYYGVNTLKKSGLGSVISRIPVLKHYQSYGDTPVRFYSKKLKNAILKPVYGLEQFKLLSKAKICFNIHGEIAKGCAGNLRLFEATGVGSCLITDWKENMSELFELDKEVITYKSIEECMNKIRWLLKNPAESLKIAKAGQARTLKDHSVSKRASAINDIFLTHL